MYISDVKSIILLICVFCFISIEGRTYEHNYEEVETPFDQSLLPIGEKLTYKMYLFGRFLKVGNAEFTINELDQDGRSFYHFSGKGQGGYLFYTVKMALDGFVDKATLKPVEYVHLQTGFEKRCRKLIFDWNTNILTYYKKKLLTDLYRKKSESSLVPGTRDILSVVYFARSIPPVVGYSRVVRFVEKREIWTVTIRVAEKQTIRLKNGYSVKALLLHIEPHHDLHEGNEVFRALFSGKKRIGLWVTEDYRIPLMIEGKLPYKWLPIPFTVILSDWFPAERIDTQ